MNRTRVPRWRGALAGTLLMTTLGLLYAEHRLFAAALVPLAYVAFGALSSLSRATTPSVERTFDPASPPPGAAVEVTLRVRNDGESALSDVRVIDGVPDELAVIEGAPRAALALRPGEEATVSYSVVAKRGDHEFDDPAVRVRTASATDRVTAAVEASGETTLSCARSVSDPPFGQASPRRIGTHTTDSGGEGVEFHSTREYRPGDPLSRIDWRRFAKSGDLTTVQFREERAARTVVVVDARPVARTTPSAGYPNGAELCAYAGERLYDALTAANVATSVTAVGLDEGDVTGGLPADALPWAASDARGSSARLVFEAVGRAADRDDPDEVPSDGADGVPTDRMGWISTDDGAEISTGQTEATAKSAAEPATAGSAAATVGGRKEDDGCGNEYTPDTKQDDADAKRDGAYVEKGEENRDKVENYINNTKSTVHDGNDARDESGDASIHRLLARLPADAQVVLVSPVLDDWPASLARSLSTRGYDLAVLSPDVTGESSGGGSVGGRSFGEAASSGEPSSAGSSDGGSPGRTVAGTHRAIRLWDLRTTGATTVDWDVDDPLDIALERSLRTLL